MIILIFTEILFGILIFVRILDELRTKKLIYHEHVTKIVVGFLIWHVILATCSRQNELLFVLSYAISMLAIVFLPFILRHFRQNQFYKARILILNSLILKMKAGESVRMGLLHVADSRQPWLRAKIEHMQEALEFNNEKNLAVQTDKYVDELVNILRVCDKESHLAMQRLLIYRHKLEVEERFHKKVTHALKSNRAQSLVLSIMYLGLLYYVVQIYSFQEYKKIIIGSCILFAVGTVGILRQGRKLKWKV